MLLVGIIYFILNLLFICFGVFLNIEIYFNLFIVGVFLFFFKYCSYIVFLVVGLLLGIGFVIKYVVFFDGLAFGVFFMF